MLSELRQRIKNIWPNRHEPGVRFALDCLILEIRERQVQLKGNVDPDDEPLIPTGPDAEWDDEDADFDSRPRVYQAPAMDLCDECGSAGECGCEDGLRRHDAEYEAWLDRISSNDCN